VRSRWQISKLAEISIGSVHIVVFLANADTTRLRFILYSSMPQKLFSVLAGHCTAKEMSEDNSKYQILSSSELLLRSLHFAVVSKLLLIKYTPTLLILFLLIQTNSMDISIYNCNGTAFAVIKSIRETLHLHYRVGFYVGPYDRYTVRKLYC
jgi:hypothetical protein